MLKKICDRCGQELNQQPHYDIDAQNFGALAQQAKPYYHYDLCQNCMIVVNKFIQRGVDDEKGIKQ
jgi:hypothetical protein